METKRPSRACNPTLWLLSADLIACRTGRQWPSAVVEMAGRAGPAALGLRRRAVSAPAMIPALLVIKAGVGAGGKEGREAVEMAAATPTEMRPLESVHAVYSPPGRYFVVDGGHPPGWLGGFP